MFIYIFSLFTIPSVINYFSEKAELAAKTASQSDKKIPGYSKKKSEEKKDSAFLLTVAAVFGMFAYNCWGLYMNFHGVNVYMVTDPKIQSVIGGYDNSEKTFEAMRVNADLYSYLVQLEAVDCGYAIVSTSDSYDGFLEPIRAAADYAGTGLNRPRDFEAKEPAYTEYNDRNGEAFTNGSVKTDEPIYTSQNGIKITNNGGSAAVTDGSGQLFKLEDGKIGFFLFDENGTIFDATKFTIDYVGRKTEKISAE